KARRSWTSWYSIVSVGIGTPPKEPQFLGRHSYHLPLPKSRGAPGAGVWSNRRGCALEGAASKLSDGINWDDTAGYSYHRDVQAAAKVAPDSSPMILDGPAGHPPPGSTRKIGEPWGSRDERHPRAPGEDRGTSAAPGAGTRAGPGSGVGGRPVGRGAGRSCKSLLAPRPARGVRCRR